MFIYDTGALKIHICNNVFIAPCKVTAPIPESRKFFLGESGMRDIFACAIRKHGLWNPAFSSRNPESWNPSYTDKESCIQCLESGIHNPRLSWITLYGVMFSSDFHFPSLVHQHNRSSNVCKGIVRFQVRPSLYIIYCHDR